MIRLVTITSATLMLCSCSFVQLTEAGNNVAQATATDVINCRDIGEVETQTKDRVVIKRGSSKVQEELIVLARNRAGAMGANAIVPVGEPIEGVQRFRAYQCD